MIRSWPWVALGTFVAALAAGGFVGLEFGVATWIASFLEGSSSDGAIPLGLLTGSIASIGFLIGLIFPGIPIWLTLYGCGKTSRLSAIVTGVLSASIAGASLAAQGGWSAAALSALGLALPGAVAALVVRAFAYLPVTPRPPRARP